MIRCSAIFFHVIDILTLNVIDLSNLLNSISAGVTRMVMDVLPSFAVTLVGLSLDDAFLRALSKKDMDWYNLLKSRKRSSRTFFDHIIRMWRRLRRTMVFSLVLVVLSILPQGYLLVSIATAFARASALTLFTGRQQIVVCI
eukprot:GHVR01026993.1.p1 GENE.GHVR01026993.1~~GHVR01026993.1.p1  ORF type:complete len:142 (+),score=6.54 GHVR01026993.1:266-691(+)